MRGTRWWAGATLALLAVAVLVYAVAQQVGRRGADDEARAVGVEWAQRLDADATALSAVSGPGRELTSAAQPFVVLYGADHDVIASEVTVGGRAPDVPAGVLDGALARGTDHVTWQPASGVREAVYATAWQRGSDRGVVVSGIGLGPTEDRAALLRTALAVGWLTAVTAVGAALLMTTRLRDAGPTPPRRPPPRR